MSDAAETQMNDALIRLRSWMKRTPTAGAVGDGVMGEGLAADSYRPAAAHPHDDAHIGSITSWNAHRDAVAARIASGTPNAADRAEVAVTANWFLTYTPQSADEVGFAKARNEWGASPAGRLVRDLDHADAVDEAPVQSLDAGTTGTADPGSGVWANAGTEEEGDAELARLDAERRIFPGMTQEERWEVERQEYWAADAEARREADRADDEADERWQRNQDDSTEEAEWRDDQTDTSGTDDTASL